MALGSCDVSFHTLAARPAAMAAPRTVISVKSGRTESKGKKNVNLFKRVGSLGTLRSHWGQKPKVGSPFLEEVYTENSTSVLEHI